MDIIKELDWAAAQRRSTTKRIDDLNDQLTAAVAIQDRQDVVIETLQRKWEAQVSMNNAVIEQINGLIKAGLMNVDNTAVLSTDTHDRLVALSERLDNIVELLPNDQTPQAERDGDPGWYAS